MESWQVSTRSRCKSNAPWLQQQRRMKEKSMHRLRLWPSNAEVGSPVPNRRNQRETARLLHRIPFTGEAFRRAEMPEVAFDDSIALRRMKSSRRRSTGPNMRVGSPTFFAITGTWFEFLIYEDGDAREMNLFFFLIVNCNSRYLETFPW